LIKRASRAVILWGALPLVREDYRLSQFHRLCLQAKALMRNRQGEVHPVIFIVSDEERLF
jgi:hypothetical protein